MEKNKTGLSSEQMTHVRRAFRMIDSNGNGRISSSELARAARVLGYNPSLREVQQMIASVDHDCNGQIDFSEFAQLMRDRFGALEYQAIAVKDAFKTLDKDGNGFIDYHELWAFLKGTGEDPLTEAEFQSVIQDLDVNKDGKIDYNELAKKMCTLEDTN
ncbi:calmodulin-like [Babylonia areolata]|uniref:calmodulin-like n=1 Tax=Babylonia areolata TaxID=304850 RepID=UPI003FD0B3A1